tara:strand:- start:35 stop:550 length:516 start_codon:yes stop_codon:yes gene_type:complete
MAVSTQKVLASGGGHSGQVGMTINEKELKDIIKSLDALRLDEKGDKKILQKAMRQAARPILKELRANVDTMIKPSREGASSKKTGQLKKSLAIINGKVKPGMTPSIYVGPRVKGAFANEDKTGFYFYFFEYGFNGKPGLRMLDDAARSKGQQALNDVINKLKKLIEKQFKK